MNTQKSQTTPDTILRLREVLQKTGFSRSTLYNKIAKNEFPHQVSLGARAVGWLKQEVDGWISERIRLRPNWATEISDDFREAAHAIPLTAQNRRIEFQRSIEPTVCVVPLGPDAPDLTQLHVVNTKLYFDRSTGNFWLKLHAENPGK